MLLCLKMVESVLDNEKRAELTSAVVRSLLGHDPAIHSEDPVKAAKSLAEAAAGSLN